jgi:hypothetical protein
MKGGGGDYLANACPTGEDFVNCDKAGPCMPVIVGMAYLYLGGWLTFICAMWANVHDFQCQQTVVLLWLVVLMCDAVFSEWIALPHLPNYYRVHRSSSCPFR